jgi:AraC family transcriptional regulator, regulatory protein of adaptative response / DNA-3-methyladenine glycosylase II
VPPPRSVATAVEFLAARAVPGIEDVRDGVFRRTLSLPHGPGTIELSARSTLVRTRDPRDQAAAEAACRRLLGSEPAAAAADAHLAADPHLGPLVAARPRWRVPGTVDGGELALRAVLGQQVSLAAARTLAGRLVAAAGERVAPDDGSSPTRLWPRPELVVEAAPSIPMPRARRVGLAALAAALAAGELRLEPGADPDEVRGRLLELPGIGPWTAEYVGMRALGDPDAWLPTDLGVRRGLARLGIGEDAASAWRPYRAHAVAHLWAGLDPPIVGAERCDSWSRAGPVARLVKARRRRQPRR